MMLPEIVYTPGFKFLLFNLLAVWPLWRIFARAGLRPWLALLVLLPVVGLLAVVVILSLTRWPTLPPRKPKIRKARKVVP